MTTKKPIWRRRWVKVLVGLPALFFGISLLTNLLMPHHSATIDRLSAHDKGMVAEIFHLRQAMGDSLWPGFGKADIPVLLYNESYAFLIGYPDPDPATGWRSIPRLTDQGGPWEPVPGDSLNGLPYYRQRLEPGKLTPQAFTVIVGPHWAASMTTRDWMLIKMGNDIGESFPPAIRLFLPYRLLGRLVGAFMTPDAFVCAVEHESFHAFQGQIAPGRLTEAEQALAAHGDRYPWDNPDFSKGWKAEMGTLIDGLNTPDEEECRSLARRFLELRQERRSTASLDTALIELERLREWEEGLAKYVELALWKMAAKDSTYQPAPERLADRRFDRYQGFSRRWQQELSTARFQGGAGETRFYYSGMAQGFLLDRLSPGWRERVWPPEGWLEDLLAEALQ